MALPGKIRIIAGQWRGRKLDVMDAEGLRPTPDRIRETLFNWLQTLIPAANCLDLYAGTGALAFEALSREAMSVVMIENNPSLVKQLQNQATTLKSDRHEINQPDALAWLKNNDKTFDIIFLDPPFNKGLVEKSLQIIKDKQLLNANGRVYVEAERSSILPEGWQVIKEKHAGQVSAMLIKQNN